MSIASVNHRHVFGLKGDVHNNIAYLDELNVVYPVGSNVIIYNTETKAQRFIAVAEKADVITAMCLSQTKKFLAVGLRSEKAASVVIYDIASMRKRKTLVLADVESKEVACLDFSADSKSLLVQLGSPDWTLQFWTWEKAKLMASVRPSQQIGAHISSVSFSPYDPTFMCATGNGIFKLYRYTEGQLKPVHFKVEPRNYLCHAWISEERILVGSEDSHVLVFDDGEVRGELFVSATDNEARRGIHSLVGFSKGFVCGTNNGNVFVYERSEEPKEFYKTIRQFSLPEDSSRVINMTLSPNEDNLLCSTDVNQLYYIGFGSTEIIKSEEAHFELLSHPFHHGQISGMDVCVRKPLIATCGMDKSIRIWNYMENTNELTKYFPEESLSVSIHPSGLYLLAGFSDKLRLMNLLIDDIRVFREFPIRGCREVRFSNGGQYFAAANGNTVQLFNTWTFENFGNLKGHNGKVRSISWSVNDARIVTAGADGAVYEWSVKDFRRLGENVVKACAYSSAVASPDGKAIYAVGSDKSFKEITDSQVSRDVPMEESLTQVLLSHSGRMLFTGTSNGSVRAMKYPFGHDAGESHEHQAHYGTVTKMRLSIDDQYLFSASEDGSLYIFRVTDKESKLNKRDREIEYADEILVTKTDLEGKDALMSDLKARVEELKMENEYQLRLKDLTFSEKIKDATDHFSREIEALKATARDLRSEKEKEEVRHMQDVAAENEMHAKEMMELETVHSAKILAEYEKFQELQNKTTEMQQKWETQLAEMDEAREQALAELTNHYEEKLKEKQAEIEKLQEEMRTQIRDFEEMTKDTEEDADTEVMEIKNRYEKKLQEEKESGQRLKGENAIMKKKFNTLHTEIESHKADIQKMYAEEKKLHNIIKALEKDTVGLKKEIKERDGTIQDKEKRIYDLKKKNQELEKFKFVLDYKIKELKHQIEPRENEILAMTQQIKEMDVELEQYHTANNKLELAINDLRQKLHAAEKEVDNERNVVHEASAVVKGFKLELSQCMASIQDAKLLKTNLKDLYHRYCKDLVKGSTLDTNAQKEFTRQRDYLEKKVISTRNQIVKEQKSHRLDNSHVMSDNILLLKEINQLRTNLKDMKQRELEAGPAGTNSQFLAQTASSEQFRTASTHLSEPRQAPTLPDIRATLDAALVAQAPASSTDSGQVLGKQASGLKS